MRFDSTVIFVEEIQRAKKFYTEILEQHIVHDFGRNIIFQSGIAIWEVDKNHCITKKLNTADKNSNRFELYFEHDDIKAMEEKLTEQNIRFLHRRQQEPWGQQTIRFFDPDNHLIEVGEPLSCFISRMYKNGMTIEQINEKTHVAVETIKKLIAK